MSIKKITQSDLIPVPVDLQSVWGAELRGKPKTIAEWLVDTWLVGKRYESWAVLGDDCLDENWTALEYCLNDVPTWQPYSREGIREREEIRLKEGIELDEVPIILDFDAITVLIEKSFSLVEVEQEHRKIVTNKGKPEGVHIRVDLYPMSEEHSTVDISASDIFKAKAGEMGAALSKRWGLPEKQPPGTGEARKKLPRTGVILRVAVALMILEKKQATIYRDAASRAGTTTSTINKYQDHPRVKSIMEEFRRDENYFAKTRSGLTNRKKPVNK